MKPHHAFFKSKYFKEDRDGDWNLFELDHYDHYCIHHGSTDEEIQRGKEISKRCREIALKRYNGKHKEKLIEIMRNRYGFDKARYKKNICQKNS